MNLRTVLTLGTLALTAIHSQAITLLGNLPGNGNYKGGNALLGAGYWAAVGVKNGTNAVYFNSLQGYFNTLNSTTSDKLHGGIYLDGGNVPDASKLVASFNDLVLPANTDPTLQTLLTSSMVTLAANTKYWFVTYADSTPNVLWRADNTLPNGTLPVSDPVLNGTLLSYQKNIHSGGAGYWFAGTANYTVKIDVTPVPEPGQWAMMGVTLAGVAGFVARRLRTRRLAA